MKQDNPKNNFPPAQAVKLTNLVEYANTSIVSRTITGTDAGTMTLFAFDAGQALSEHSAPFDAFVQVLEGETELMIGGQKVITRAGETVLMPAHIPHGVKAVQKFKMLLTMIRG